jgi:eukaryotic-like serine/threonine-protein kinase
LASGRAGPRGRPAVAGRQAGTGAATWKSRLMSASQLPTARPQTKGAPVPGHDPSLVLGRYRLGRKLGAGGFGTVWIGHDERLDRDVAVKALPRERIVGGRFEREARAAARLTHPGIVTLYEAAVDDDGAYLVSELIRGKTLATLIEAGRLSDRDIVEIAIALCDALGHAHAHGIVHRDVKPSNVLIPDRPTSRAHPAKLTDFGVARVIGGDSLTRTGDVVGTAAYMAPEQAEGREVGPPADLYAVALVTYEALTGINPVRTTMAAVRARRLGAHLPPVRRQRRDLPRDLGRGIDLALRPRARERGTLDELRSALVASLPELSDEPGVVVTAWPRLPLSHTGDEEAGGPSGLGDGERQFASDPEDADVLSPAVGGDAPISLSWPARALGATAAAIGAAWAAVHLLGPLPVAAPALAVLTWLFVLTLPRIGWLASGAILVAAAAAREHPGGALVLLIAILLPVLLIPWRATSWPLAIAAPVLGAVGLAGAWPALAGRASGFGWRRAALAAIGYVWVIIASLVVGTDLYVRRPPGSAAPAVWTGSLDVTLHHVLVPLVKSGVLAGAPIWGIAAAALPWLLRGRALSACVVITTVWSAVLVSATETAVAIVHHGHGFGTPRGAVLGAVAGGLIALAPALYAHARLTRFSGNPQAELP